MKHSAPNARVVTHVPRDRHRPRPLADMAWVVVGLAMATGLFFVLGAWAGLLAKHAPEQTPAPCSCSNSHALIRAEIRDLRRQRHVADERLTVDRALTAEHLERLECAIQLVAATQRGRQRLPAALLRGVSDCGDHL